MQGAGGEGVDDSGSLARPGPRSQIRGGECGRIFPEEYYPTQAVSVSPELLIENLALRQQLALSNAKTCVLDSPSQTSCSGYACAASGVSGKRR